MHVILPDQQIPYHDRELHECVLRFLDTNRDAVKGIVYSGDTIDLPGISRHDWDPDMDPDPLRSTARAIRETRTYFTEITSAVDDDADQTLVPGNHEHRLRAFVIRHAKELWFLQEEDGEQTLDLGRILGLRKLGIRLAPGTWPGAKHWLTDKLAVIHGKYVRQKSGASALYTLEQLGHSVIMGHTHRMGMVFDTKHPRKGAETRVAVEAGTLARLEGGLGYAPDPNWQNGFATVRLFPDGGFHCSLATYVRGVLRWEGQEYVYRRGGVRVSG